MRPAPGAYRRHLVVMAKAPVAGRVKTRLAREIGTAEALRAYRALLGGTVRRLGGDPRWRLSVAVNPDRAVTDLCWPHGIDLVPQGAGSLGERMQRLFDTLPRGPVVIVGSDVPGVQPADIADAFRALGRCAAVFGPAEDGGYWLVGARRLPRVPRFFTAVRWSHPRTLSDTLANFAPGEAGFVRRLRDLDTAADYRAWLERAPHMSS